jgi:hypothetical protein
VKNTIGGENKEVGVSTPNGQHGQVQEKSKDEKKQLKKIL